MSLRDPLAAIVIFALSATFFVLSGNYTGGAEIFPRGVSAIMMVCAVLLFIKGLRGSTESERMTPDAMRRVASVVALTIIYIFAVDVLGFVTSSLLFIPATSYVLGVKNYKLIAFSTIIFVAAVSYLFRKVFVVPLPPELILTFF